MEEHTNEKSFILFEDAKYQSTSDLSIECTNNVFFIFVKVFRKQRLHQILKTERSFLWLLDW